MNRKQFTFYRSFFTGIRRIRSKAARCEAYDALVEYALDGIEPDLDSMADAAAMVFEMVKPTLEVGRRKSEAGQKGGESKPQANDKQTESKSEANRKVDIDIDIDIGLMSNNITSVCEAWNKIGLAQVSKVSPGTTRYKMLSARIREYGIDDVLKAVEMVKQSDFLRGQNNSGFMATLDWMIKPNNFQKVIDGNYAKKTTKRQATNSPEYFGKGNLDPAVVRSAYQRLLEVEHD